MNLYVNVFNFNTPYTWQHHRKGYVWDYLVIYECIWKYPMEDRELSAGFNVDMLFPYTWPMAFMFASPFT